MGLKWLEKTTNRLLWTPSFEWVQACYNSPIDTNLTFSWSKNSRATETLSSLSCLKVGRVWYFLNILLWLRTSSSEIRMRPSLRSNLRSQICSSTDFRCSLHQRVKVFFWIFFHGASSARLIAAAVTLYLKSPIILSDQCGVQNLLYQTENCNLRAVKHEAFM